LAIAPYEAETLTSFELGSKNRFLADRLQVDGALFYYDYGAFQQAVQTGSLFCTGLYTVANSPAEVLGAELELLYQPTSHDRLGLSISYVDARYRNKPALFTAGVVENEIPGVVPFSVYPSYTHTFALPGDQTLSIGLEALYHSGYDVVAVDQAQAAAGLLPYVAVGNQVTGNINATWKVSRKFSFSAYVRNVSDERYKTFLNISSTADSVGAAVLSDPRTFGAVLRVAF
jgi:iron complex outermembrane receptor protein